MKDKTPRRTIRVSDELWASIKERAAADGRTVTDIIIESLERY